MQGAELCNNVTDADAIAYLENAVISPVLMYGISKTSFPHGNASSKAIESRNWRTQMVTKFSCLESIEH